HGAHLSGSIRRGGGARRRRVHRAVELPVRRGRVARPRPVTQRVLIVDDEAPARERLRSLLGELDGVEVAAEGADGEQAVRLAGELHPDVVLLDVRMPGMNGLEAARHLALFESPPAVVFTTAYDAYAVEAFEAQAIGYLLKPVRTEKLGAALQRA